ncbi:MAG: PepSY domain-containing protein [Gillisia sp.]
MRIIHRYLGFFLAGIMAMYALSGITMIFRDTNFLKRDTEVTRKIQPGATVKEIASAVRTKELKIQKETENTITFEKGTYNKNTGEVKYTIKAWPSFITNITRLHKARTADPLFFFNVFFGVSLLFFVISSFYMFMPKTPIFKKGMIFTFFGIVLTIILLYV